ncbi:integrase core domain-containing protein [Nonomuraea sp. AD125B]|uniref:integrase core domain-containing protein n=1 Tax=Nonomuraea sp. AD125B TaxID=3242897 RepID=UPI003527C67C
MAGSLDSAPLLLGPLSAGGRHRCVHRHVGDALDNALIESQIGLCKTELIKLRGPWRSLAEVELATAEWVVWFNTCRPRSSRRSTSLSITPKP